MWTFTPKIWFVSKNQNWAVRPPGVFDNGSFSSLQEPPLSFTHLDKIFLKFYFLNEGQVFVDGTLFNTAFNFHQVDTKVLFGQLVCYQNKKVKVENLAAVGCIQNAVILLLGISCQFMQLHHWGYSLTWSPGEASLKSNTSNMPEGMPSPSNQSVFAHRKETNLHLRKKKKKRNLHTCKHFTICIRRNVEK